jgi:hypothetical protein
VLFISYESMTTATSSPVTVISNVIFVHWSWKLEYFSETYFSHFGKFQLNPLCFPCFYSQWDGLVAELSDTCWISDGTHSQRITMSDWTSFDLGWIVGKIVNSLQNNRQWRRRRRQCCCDIVSCIFYAGLKCRETLEEKEDAQWHAFIIHIGIADTTVVLATTVLHHIGVCCFFWTVKDYLVFWM